MKISKLSPKMGRVLGYIFQSIWNKISQTWNNAAVTWDKW